MIRSLSTAITGLRGHQIRFDVVGNNIANVNTTAFKSAQARFEDLFSQTIQGATAPGGGAGGSNPMQVGLGMRVSSILNNHAQGPIQYTGRGTDLAVEGAGFFVVGGGGDIFYTRDGSFSLDREGTLVNPNGLRVQGWMSAAGVLPPPADMTEATMTEITVRLGEPYPNPGDPDLLSFVIDTSGVVTGLLADGSVLPLGQLAMANFQNAEGLGKRGGNLYEGTANSGAAAVGTPNTGGRGQVRAYSLEMSNVDLAYEFTEMIVASRGFQANTRVVSTSDEILVEVINMKR